MGWGSTVLQLWVGLACLYGLGGRGWSGVQAFGHFIHFYEVLLPPTLCLVIHFALHGRRVPISIALFLGYGLIVVSHGLWAGNFASIVYDRFRTLLVLLVCVLLFQMQLSTEELWRIIRPAVWCSLLGNIGTVLSGIVANSLGAVSHVLSVGYFGVLVYLQNCMRRPKIGHLLCISVPLIYAFHDMARMMLICMSTGLAVTAILGLRRASRRSVLASGVVASCLGLIYFFAPVSDVAAKGKDVRAGGLTAGGLAGSTEARIRELEVIQNMTTTELLFGKGEGASWDGSYLYTEDVGLERRTFHIYSAQILYCGGMVGVGLLCVMIVVPVQRSLRSLATLDEVGTAGLIYTCALTLLWFGSSSETWYERFSLSVAMYAMFAGINSQGGCACTRVVDSDGVRRPRVVKPVRSGL